MLLARKAWRGTLVDPCLLPGVANPNRTDWVAILSFHSVPTPKIVIRKI
jgi:hypothetical protein